MDTIKHGNESSYSHRKRMEYTVEFVESHLRETESVLDVGDPGNLGRMLAGRFGCKYIYTVGDLDGLNWRPVKGNTFDTVFCFEVLEHLLNPLLFLQELKKYITEETKVFVSTPHRPCIIQSKHAYHWKEMSWIEIRYLFERAGYEEITFRSELFRKPPLFYFKGIRPLIRLFFDVDGLHLIKKTQKTP